jgi:glucosamine--fructose-6-phosphate aminotransferase (isomerizing)
VKPADRILLRELHDAPNAVARQEQEIREPLRSLVARLVHTPPKVVVTCARGSSAHAAAYGKHLIERYLGIPVAAAAPNIVSVYRQDLQLRDQFLLVISQSGQSDDLIEQARSARRAGATTAALVNNVDSPLAAECEFVLPLAAGPELAVAATKSYIASLSALLRLTAVWADHREIGLAVDRLPARLAAAAELDWHEGLDILKKVTDMIVLGRGPTLAVAREAALKLKETCGLSSQAYSGAELMHGPITLVSDGYPILVFMPTDEAAAGMRLVTRDLLGKGAKLLVTGADDDGVPLATLPSEQADADAVCLVQSFYAMMIGLAEARGTSANNPRHLQKVTRTR